MQPRNPIIPTPFLNTFRKAAESMFDLYEQPPDCYLEGIQTGITARQWIKIYYMVVFILDPQALEVNSSNALRHHLVKHLMRRGQGTSFWRKKKGRWRPGVFAATIPGLQSAKAELFKARQAPFIYGTKLALCKTEVTNISYGINGRSW